MKLAYARFLFSTALAALDTVLTVSEFTHGELLACFGQKATDVDVIPKCVD